MRARSFAVVLTAVVASVTLAADNPSSFLVGNSGPFKRIDTSPAHERSRQLLLHQRNQARAAAAPAAQSQDIGDVAVIVDNGAILVPASAGHPFDLTAPSAIVFTPTTGGFGVAASSVPFDSAVGTPLALGDDDTTQVLLGFAVPFLGASYSSIWVNSDGNITFGAGDAGGTNRDAAGLIGGPPRIAPLLADLDPSSGGTVSARVDATRVVVTWKDVAQFGIGNANTFQATIDSNGVVTFTYERLEASFSTLLAPFGVVGVAAGGDQGPFNEIDLTTDLPVTLPAGAIFEEFSAAHGTQVDIVELSNEFYRTHADKYDFLVTFTDGIVDLGGAFAFEFNVSNQTQGIGLPIFDESAVFGSAGELESFVMMNRIGLEWPDARKLVDPPIDKFLLPGQPVLGPPGATQLSRRARRMGTLNGDFGAYGTYSLGLNSGMSILGQEAAHRWGAFVPFFHPTKGIGLDSLDLLGRDLAHWSFFFNVQVPAAQFGGDPRASSLEGNAIIDFGGNVFGDCVNAGETRFRTQPNELVDGYTALDQYLLGVRVGSDVGQFWYVDDPTRPVAGTSFENIRAASAIDDVGICGKRINLTVANIQVLIGPRVPAIGDETDRDASGAAQSDRKTMAFVLLVAQGAPNSPAHAAAIDQVDTFRQTWQLYVNGPGTGGRGRFDTGLNPAIY
jgi:hypothetical protein